MPLVPPRVDLVVSDGNLARSGSTPPQGPLAVIGPCSAGPINEPTPFTSVSDLTSVHGFGPAVEAAAYALAYEVDEVLFTRTDPTDETPGVYGAITQTWANADPPVATADNVVKPGDDLEPVILWTTSGSLGTERKYQYSLDGERKFSGDRVFAAGDTSITLPYGGGKYNISPPAGADADLIALVDEERLDFNGHIALTSGGVHGAADTGPYAGLGSAPTTITEAQTVMAALLVAAKLHVVKTSSSIHGAADDTALAALNAIATPTSFAMTIVAANAFKAAFFGEIGTGHISRTENNIHGAADTTSEITSSNAEPGNVTAGDKTALVTDAPRWSIDNLVVAIQALRDTSLPFSVPSIAGPVMTAGESLAIQAALDELGSKVRYRRAVGHFRLRGNAGNEGESLPAYAAAYELAHPLSSSIARRLALTPSWYCPSAVNPGAVYVRPWSFHAAARAAIKDASINPIWRDGWGSATGAVRDSRGKLLPRSVDEGMNAVLTARRCWAPMTRPEFPGEILSSQAALLSPEGSDYSVLQYGRVVDLACEIGRIEAARRLGAKIQPGVNGKIDGNEKKRIEGQINKVLEERLVKTQQAARTSVKLDPNTVVVGLPPIKAKMWVYVQPFGTIDIFEVEVALVATLENPANPAL